MTIQVDTTTGPACWASYLINGDCSGLDPIEVRACDRWLRRLGTWYVVDVADDEPRFSWSYDLHGGTARGGDVVDYVIHRSAEA